MPVLSTLLKHFADGHFGVLLDVLHVGLNNIKAIFFNEARDQPNPLVVGGDLGLQVGDVLLEGSGPRTPRELRWVLKQGFDQCLFLEGAPIDNLELNRVNLKTVE